MAVSTSDSTVISKSKPTSHASASHADTPGTQHHSSFWLWVLCLTGVDYFSTLGYQPSIAFKQTGTLSPLATLFLVFATLFGALPVYRYVAGQSFQGQGSIAMLERLTRGWGSKILVLILLGFAATDFIITKTLSAADATEHLINNPYWKSAPDFLQGHHGQVRLTLFLLVMLGAMFLRGFTEVIGLAVVLVVIYMSLNALIIGSGLAYLVAHPALFDAWLHRLQTGDWHIRENPLGGTSLWHMLALCVLFFPKLALGLSGFETGVAVMPLIRGDASDTPQNPAGRIRNARKLLLTAAVTMSCYLIGSSLVVATLIEPAQLIGGPAENRALAFLAHRESQHVINPFFGKIFGTIYDISTVAILWFAGASAMSGLLNLIPRYLPRYGMAPGWAAAIRPLVLLLTSVNLFVTWIFDASVEKQGAAYATGVMVLISSACVAVIIDKFRKASGSFLARVPWPFVGIGAMFIYATIVILTKPLEGKEISGLQIALTFTAVILVSSVISRALRSTELRFVKFDFVNPESRLFWDTLRDGGFPVLVPHRPGGRGIQEKEDIIRQKHRLSQDTPIVFIEASVGDSSEFYQSPIMEIVQEQGRFIIRVTRCASIAHVVAIIALELSKSGTPPEVHFGWSDESPFRMNLGFLLFGEGNVPWIVHDLIRRAEPDPPKRPNVIIG